MKPFLLFALLAGSVVGCTPATLPSVGKDHPLNPDAPAGPSTGPSSLRDGADPTTSATEDAHGGHHHEH